MVVHQLIPNFTPGDAMGAAAVGLRRLLRRLGHPGGLYAAEVAPQFHSLVEPASALRPGPDALVLYHHGIASPLAGQLMQLRCPTGVVFHNITPARLYAGTALEEPLIAGRAQLAALAPHVALSVGVSDYNSSELRIAGHRNVHTVPLFIEPWRFDADRVDEAALRELKGEGPTVLSVGRLVPHKRVEDLLALHAELLALRPTARLLLVGTAQGSAAELSRLKARARALGRVSFLGRLEHAQLVAAYRSADVYVSMSEHEGFGVPLVEAFAAELPVLAFAAAAVPQTLDGRGVAFTEKRFAALAELVLKLTEDDALRTALIEGQRERLEALSPEAAQASLAAALESLPPPPTPSRPARHRRSERPRVALVVQRFGEAIVGGAEAHARQVALKLSAHASVTVLTTCATDHLTWANALPPGEEEDGPLKVLRFPSSRTRQMRAFNRLSQQIFAAAQDFVSEEHWVAEQGPLVPDLHSHLAAHREAFDAFIFFTSLYAPTAWGLPLVAHKALLVPTAHDEPAFRLETFRDCLTLPRALLCNSVEEETLIRHRHPDAARARVVAVGVDVPGAPRPERFAQAYGVRGPYLLYVGRLEAGKGVPELLKVHRALVKRFHDAPTLVLAGQGALRVQGPKVRCVGRISEAEKFDALAGALAAVVPSRFESLSLLALEAFAVGTPVLGLAECEVIAGHVARSKAGFCWHTPEGFVEAVRKVGLDRASLRTNALRYARRYRWPRVVDAYLEEIERIRKANA